MSELYQGLRNEAKSIGENNDCGVKALAVVTGLSYSECHAKLEHHGRKHGKGTYLSSMFGALRELGFSWVKTSCDHRGMRSLSRNLPKDGNFLIHATRHFAGASGGKIHDWSENRCLRIIKVYQIFKVGENPVIHEFKKKETTNRTRKTTVLYNLTHPEMGVVANYKRLPTKIVKAINSRAYLIVNNRRYLSHEFKLERI